MRLSSFLLAAACWMAPSAVAAAPLELFDAARQRPVPIELYGLPQRPTPKPLAILSHGYGGHSTEYRFLADYLVAHGYLVASIEHLERPGDPAMANSGDLATLRRPVWRIGADSIAFVAGELRRRKLALTKPKPIVVGHSNGGDMTMLFASEHPEAVSVAVSLDNRRMPLPRVRRPKICSIRSSDLAADPGVLPSPEKRAALGMTIAAVPVKHDEMWDGATESQKAAMLAALGQCLGHRTKSAGR